ncbi:MAG: hypothetical protein ACI9XZ_003983 [Alphaproteobacteria bacterium]|jgi:hypothetical protein
MKFIDMYISNIFLCNDVIVTLDTVRLPAFIGTLAS